MIRWGAVFRNVLASGTASAAASAAMLAVTGRREAGSLFAPVNAISHWFFGERAKRRDDATAKYTLSGLLTHVGASLFWATLYEMVCALRRRPTAATRLVDGAAVAAIACFVDYRLTPDRLKPGYEDRLSRRALALVYAAFAIGLALGAQAVHARCGTARAGPGD